MEKNIDIRKAWKEFMESHGHHEIENVSLVPENDPSLLFVNSGMFPLVPYLTGKVSSKFKRLYNIQRCVRFDDIEEVGDDRHTSFFHMIGNWSLGDYFKETQINLISEFLFEKINIDPNRIYITVFAGNEIVSRDDESIELWKKVFKKYDIEAEVSKIQFDEKTAEPLNAKNWNIDENTKERIFAYPMKKNWWTRGKIASGEVGGPDSEMFYDTKREHDKKYGDKCHLNCDCGRFIEIGNNVFMQYQLNENLQWIPLDQKNVDHGSGFERIAMAVMNESDIFLTSEFLPIIKELEKISQKKYQYDKKNFQIISDHMRAAVFIISDGIFPSNKDQGYIVRRLLRRSIRSAKKLGIDNMFAESIVKIILDMFSKDYPHLEDKKEIIISEIKKEENKFSNSLQKGLKELEKIIFDSTAIQKKNTTTLSSNDLIITPEQIFNLYQSFGFPIEMTIEEVEQIAKDKNLIFEKGDLLTKVRSLIKEHQEKSRSNSEVKFKGGLADTSDKTTAFHTTAHLFLEAARRVLGDHVHQKGSNITNERIRFDFSHSQKLSEEQIRQIEHIVNENIDLELEMELKEYSTDEAFRIGAEGEFREKYGSKVNVYKFYRKDINKENFSIGINKAISNDPSVKDYFMNEYIFSFEICGGPHVTNTRIIKNYGRFKITKEESSSAGVRRIKAELI